MRFITVFVLAGEETSSMEVFTFQFFAGRKGRESRPCGCHGRASRGGSDRVVIVVMPYISVPLSIPYGDGFFAG